MNGAESLVRTLVESGVDTCFANPGTSEMHFVSALDRVPGMRCILGLFEGVVTGAADGYGRLKDKPAATLLHLGPGLANGLANLHNAHRAATPIVNIVGDHATYHRKFDSPLTSDVEAVARPFSDWVRSSPSAAAISRDAAEAVSVARTAPGKIATLILPADTAWGASSGPAKAMDVPRPSQVSDPAIGEAARRLRRGVKTGILLAGHALREDALEIAGRIAAVTDAQLVASNLVPRHHRGAGRVAIETIPYAVDAAVAFLADYQQLILVGASDQPVAFFAYPDLPSTPVPESCAIQKLAGPGDDLVDVLLRLADATDARQTAPTVMREKLSPANGPVSASAIAQSLGAMMPEQAIVVDEAVSSGGPLPAATHGAAPHDWLKNMGGSIGFALPAAIGAALACPDRKVICLEADGSGMYTLQALWTQAREKLDIVTVIFNNREYAILRGELAKVQAGTPGVNATSMLDIGNPEIDWCGLSRALGVEAERATDMTGFNRCLAAALSGKGPFLIEVML